MGINIPFLGTALGAAAVIFIKNEMSDALRRVMLGFAAGVMTAASVWSLLIPAMEMSGGSFVPAATGFIAGTAFLLIIDTAADKTSRRDENGFTMFLAITLHNVPVGMAVGVAFSGVIADTPAMSLAAGMALAVGIAIQNFPEGAIISVPLLSRGKTKGKAFLCGVLSGVVEPIGASLTLILTAAIKSALPYVLSFAAGAMIYVVAAELIADACSCGKTKAGALGTAAGFVLMMSLDVLLG
ncbi:MAG: ZIP family metal transporter [Clostridiales bacterium]|nr:ZIP family metal transporter [Clostridiales bacterium]